MLICTWAHAQRDLSYLTNRIKFVNPTGISQNVFCTLKFFSQHCPPDGCGNGSFTVMLRPLLTTVGVVGVVGTNLLPGVTDQVLQDAVEMAGGEGEGEEYYIIDERARIVASRPYSQVCTCTLYVCTCIMYNYTTCTYIVNIHDCIFMYICTYMYNVWTFSLINTVIRYMYM